MSTKFTKNISVLVAVNEIRWYVENRDTLSALSIKTRWNLKKNISELEKYAKMFNELKSSIERDLNENFFNEDKSYEVNDQNNNGRVLRRVKTEYMDEYRNAYSEANLKLSELADTIEEVSLFAIDVDSEVDYIMEHGGNLSDTDLDMLSLFIYDDSME